MAFSPDIEIEHLKPHPTIPLKPSTAGAGNTFSSRSFAEIDHIVDRFDRRTNQMFPEMNMIGPVFGTANAHLISKAVGRSQPPIRLSLLNATRMKMKKDANSTLSESIAPELGRGGYWNPLRGPVAERYDRLLAVHLHVINHYPHLDLVSRVSVELQGGYIVLIGNVRSHYLRLSLRSFVVQVIGPDFVIDEIRVLEAENRV
jgi:hypothetical protein